MGEGKISEKTEGPAVFTSELYNKWTLETAKKYAHNDDIS